MTARPKPEEHASPARWLGAGFLLGWAVITELPMILPAGVIGLYLLARAWERRELPALVWVVAGGLVPLALMAVYDMAIYGTPLPAGYKYSEQWQEQVNTGFMTLTSPSLDRLWGITFSPFRGLFFSSPALLFAVPGLVAMWRVRGWRAAWWMTAGVAAALFAFNASSVVWWGGFAVGPRYVAPAVPFLALPIAAWLGRAGRWRWAFAAVGVLSIAGIAVQTITSIQFYPPEMYRFPLIDYSLPLLAQGQFALNLGNAIGLGGWAGLLPLALGLADLAAALAWLCRPAGEDAPCATP